MYTHAHARIHAHTGAAFHTELVFTSIILSEINQNILHTARDLPAPDCLN